MMKGGEAVLKKWKAAAAGLAAGVLNGLFGAGGGIIAVPLLQKSGLSPKQAHATSVAVMLVLSALSAALYLKSGRLELSAASPFLLPGVLGAAAGALLFKRIAAVWIRRVFGALVLIAAVRMLFL